MIPYEELVVALQTWRARKGLPIGQMSGSIAPPPPSPIAAPPVRVAPPVAPPSRKPPTQPPPMRAKTGSPVPPPLETTYPDESLEHSLDQELGAHLEEHLSEHGAEAEEPMTAAQHAIDETHYENEGDDFAMAFGQQSVEVDSESTSISNVPVEPGDKRGDW